MGVGAACCSQAFGFLFAKGDVEPVWATETSEIAVKTELTETRANILADTMAESLTNPLPLYPVRPLING